MRMSVTALKPVAEPEAARLGFEKDGAVLVRGLFTPSDVEPIRSLLTNHIDAVANRLKAENRISSLFAEDEPFRRLAKIRAEWSFNISKWGAFLPGPEIYRIVSHTALLDCLEPLLGRDICFNGGPRLAARIPKDERPSENWRQTALQFGLLTRHFRIITAVVALHDLEESGGCPLIIPGSQHWGLLEGKKPQESRVAHSERVEERGTPVPVLMEAGDVLLLSNLTVRSNGENRGDRVCCSINLDFYTTPGSRPMSESEVHASDYYGGQLRGKGLTPLIVRGRRAMKSGDAWRAARNIQTLRW